MLGEIAVRLLFIHVFFFDCLMVCIGRISVSPEQYVLTLRFYLPFFSSCVDSLKFTLCANFTVQACSIVHEGVLQDGFRHFCSVVSCFVSVTNYYVMIVVFCIDVAWNMTDNVDIGIIYSFLLVWYVFCHLKRHIAYHSRPCIKKSIFSLSVKYSLFDCQSISLL